MSESRVPWSPIEPLPSLNGEIANRLLVVDALASAWREVQAAASPAEIEAGLTRRLRRHAIETGIIERLYDVSWGVTEALVAEGLTSEVAMAEGDITESTLVVIRDQFDALAYLVECSREERDLSLHMIRSVHAIIVRHQSHYEARDQFGTEVRVPLDPGAWKTTPNQIVRSDGVIIECTPPLQVDAEMARLVDLYGAIKDSHPLVRTAWLHHRFVQIHPFADGNGRVARALSLLALQRAQYAPIVVDRTQRVDYIAALDEANGGDLRALVLFFARLEERSLRAELKTPLGPAPEGTGAVSVARAYAQRLLARDVADRAVKAERGAELAIAVHNKLIALLDNMSVELKEAFRQFDPSAVSTTAHAAPPDEQARYWHVQLVNAANLADFYTNLADGAWWTRLHLRVRGSLLRFIVAVQKVGQGETGVLAVTAHAEVLDASAQADPRAFLFRVFGPPNAPDSVTLVYSDDLAARWEEIAQMVDDALAAALARFSEHLA